jgi:hypothetical protein
MARSYLPLGVTAAPLAVALSPEGFVRLIGLPYSSGNRLCWTHSHAE